MIESRRFCYCIKSDQPVVMIIFLLSGFVVENHTR